MLALGPTAGVVLLVVVLVSAPLITASTRDAIGQVDPDLLEMAHAFGRGPAWRGRHTIPSNRSGFPIEGDAPMRASRRDVLAWSAAVAALGLAGCSSREGGAASSSSTSSGPIDDLRVYVPTTLAFMAPMAAFGDELKSEGAVEEVTIRNWAGVDVLTSLLLDHEADVAAVPSYVGADPCTKGDDLRLAAITVWGMLYVLGPKEDEGADDMGLLTGRRIGVPPPNDMPDLVFRYLLAQKGIDAAGIDIVPYPDAQELLNAFVSGQLDWAVCPSAPPLSPSPSPPRPAARWGASSTMQKIWAEVTGSDARFPMAGIAVPTAVAGDESLLGGILGDMESAVNTVNAAGEEIIGRIAAFHAGGRCHRRAGHPPSAAADGPGGPVQGRTGRFLRAPGRPEPRRHRRQGSRRRLLPRRSARVSVRRSGSPGPSPDRGIPGPVGSALASRAELVHNRTDNTGRRPVSSRRDDRPVQAAGEGTPE